ncbi:MAG: outer membrane lipoprotein carrier protein LolA [Myxococcota bacterium]
MDRTKSPLLNRRQALGILAGAGASLLGTRALAQGAAQGAAPGAAPGSASSQRVAVAAQVQSFYDRTSALSANFSQSYYHAIHRRTERGSGALVLDRPGRIRFDYDDGKVMISADSRVSVYEPAEGDEPGHFLQRRAAENATHEGLRFLMGTARLDEDYRFRLVDAARYRWRGHVLELRPRRASASMRRVLLYVDSRAGREGVVHRIRIDDHDGNRNTLTFRRMSFASERDASHYEFTPPPGTVLDVR